MDRQQKGREQEMEKKKSEEINNRQRMAKKRKKFKEEQKTILIGCWKMFLENLNRDQSAVVKVSGVGGYWRSLVGLAWQQLQWFAGEIGSADFEYCQKGSSK